VGLAGGGTDLSPFCDLYGGHVLNVTIGLYAYTIIEPLPGDGIELRATDIGVDEAIGTMGTQPVFPPLALDSHHYAYEWLRPGAVHWPENCGRAGVS
jgi:D-glycero-alpha-D-manno-heptose-7-phosphate kinase